MSAHSNKTFENHPIIRQLDEGVINRIAAGEVIERPASAVKELVENALDAGARRIAIDISDGGKLLIKVADDGHGISAEGLPLAVSRHATSKIDDDDLFNIRSFGFRGEALASLGAVGRLVITSRIKDKTAAEIAVTGGTIGTVRPAALSIGTIVELRDLFFATPARLKFLRSSRAETRAIVEAVRRLAMAEPFVGFTLSDASDQKKRVLLRADPLSGDFFEALHGRLTGLLGADFTQNALKIDIERDHLHVSGYAALPTYSRGSAAQQCIFVNSRPVQDRLLTGALRAAYADFLSKDRHPAAVLNINCAPEYVDVNVHPAKSEVRFRQPEAIRGLIVTGLRQALIGAGHLASSTVADRAFSFMRPAPKEGVSSRPNADVLHQAQWFQAPAVPQDNAQISGFNETPHSRVEEHSNIPLQKNITEYPLGAARAQLHENYIIAQTQDGIVIVDQHAAHERLVYERLKQQFAENAVKTQVLLIPDVIELSSTYTARIPAIAENLAKIGLVIEPFGGNALIVRETPALLGQVRVEALINDILDEVTEGEESTFLQEKINAVLSRIACHGSVRSGRQMCAEEMNALLREMEITPHSGQCNHGRPTYVELKLHDIERLFGRK